MGCAGFLGWGVEGFGVDAVAVVAGGLVGEGVVDGPGGEGDGEGEVVMFAGGGGVLFLAGGGEFDAHFGELCDEGLAVFEAGADGEAAAFEEEAEAHHEVAFGDVGVIAFFRFVVTGGDGDGDDFGLESAATEEVDDRATDAGAVNGEFDPAAPGEGLDDVGDALDDDGVLGAEGEAFEVSDGEFDLFAVGELDGVPVALLNGTLDERESGGVLALA